ncbi:MAG: hypothetical protein MZV64_30900 [Ignavibacteriales bacterium]|nr:hypothetical protein [Ignavibacteriales bacterium]
MNEDRALYWLNNGAQPTDTVKNLLSQKGILLRKTSEEKGASEEKIKERERISKSFAKHKSKTVRAKKKTKRR